MPPKKAGPVDLETEESKRFIALFESTGLSPNRSKDAVQSIKTCTAFQRLISEQNIGGEGGTKLDEKQAGLLVEVSVEGYGATGKHGAGAGGKDGSRLSREDVDYLVKAVLDGRLKSIDQVKGR